MLKSTTALLLTFVFTSFAVARETFTVAENAENANLMTVESVTGFENFTGRTSRVSGNLTFDAAAKTGGGTIVIDGASIRTGNTVRDGHMRGAAWLNFAARPDVRFQTTSVRHVEGDAYAVTGNLTLNGVTKPVTTRATVRLTKANDATKALGLAGDALAVTTRFTVKLSEFGVRNNQIGRSVNDTLTINLQFVASNR